MTVTFSLLSLQCTLTLSFETCDSKSVVVVGKFISGASQRFAVCNPCGPGFEASETCLAGLRSNSHATVMKSKVSIFFGVENLEISHCRPCSSRHYSNTYGINKTCKPCSFCGFDEKIMPCSPTADTICGTSYVFNATRATRRRSMKPIVWRSFLASRKVTGEE